MPIVVWGLSPRIDDVLAMLAQNAFATSLLDSCNAVSQNVTSPCQRVALMGLHQPPAAHAEILAVAQAFKHKGFRLVCYADASSAWSLAAQSRLLLAGGVRLLDSMDPGFGTKLIAFLCEEAEMQRRYWQGQCHIDEAMRRLGFIAESPAMRSVVRWVARISSFPNLSVLIRGEAGTGKELVAKAVHQLDPHRRDGPFIAVNCAAISSTLAESELFGHRRGAFTGAERDRRGLFRAADGGVLFLDEIGELPESLQVKLLRVLQEHRVLAVGEEQEVPVDVRVVAATNADLPAFVRQGRFRKDLFSRLNVLSVQLPPLRERCEDIGPLIAHFLEKHGALCPARRIEVGRDFTVAVARLDLAGNARQLENLVRWVMVNKEDDAPLGLRDLPQEIWQRLSQDGAALPPAEPGAVSPHGFGDHMLNMLEANRWSLAHGLDECERLVLQAALQLTSGNQTHTARLLGITSRSVYNKLRKHRLQP